MGEHKVYDMISQRKQRSRGSLLTVATLLAVALPVGASAQGYNENRTVGFRVVNQDGGLRLSKEVSRQSLSSLRNSSVSAGGGSSGTAAQQHGSDLNNVVQYYNNSSLTINVPGSNSPVTVDGGVLNAGPTSSGTSQLLNNTTQGSVRSK